MENPDFFQTDYYDPQLTPENGKNADHFAIEDLLDFHNDDASAPADAGLEAEMAGTSTDSSTRTAADNSCNSTFGSVEPSFYNAADIGGTAGYADGQFSNELCHVPHDDLAELEWLSNFVEDSFSSEDLQKLQLIQGLKTRTTESSQTHQYQFQPEATRPAGRTLRHEISVPAKARSKRSRTAPGNWTSRLLAVSPQPSADGHSESGIKKTVKKTEESENSGGGEGRRCLHCATDKTPQWRTGPMGPKTLCNACGVRYKSGRLVPEYRPAASPTFVLTKHSNSHRKVLELRRQKEMMMRAHAQQQQFLHHRHQNMMFGVSDGDHEYLIHQPIGPDFLR